MKDWGFSLGALYYLGQGVPEDVARAVTLFKQACSAAGGARRRPIT
jgi:TPR repeat protein